MKPVLQALLFDIDGTLADTEEVHRQAFNKAFKAAGLDWVWNPERYLELLSVTGGKERIRHFMQQEQPGVELSPDTDAFIAALHTDKTSNYITMMTEERVPLRPGVDRLIREAHENGLRLAIVTTTTPANVSALFKHSFGGHENDWFEVVAAGGVVPGKNQRLIFIPIPCQSWACLPGDVLRSKILQMVLKLHSPPVWTCWSLLTSTPTGTIFPEPQWCWTTWVKRTIPVTCCKAA